MVNANESCSVDLFLLRLHRLVAIKCMPAEVRYVPYCPSSGNHTRIETGRVWFPIKVGRCENCWCFSIGTLWSIVVRCTQKAFNRVKWVTLFSSWLLICVSNTNYAAKYYVWNSFFYLLVFHKLTHTAEWGKHHTAPSWLVWRRAQRCCYFCWWCCTSTVSWDWLSYRRKLVFSRDRDESDRQAVIIFDSWRM